VSGVPDRGRRTAFRFVLLIGVLSFFGDFTYEGSRSIIGPYLATLAASGTIVGIVTGLGEFLGYGLRLLSGRWADISGRYWPTAIFGYVLQMASVPALALTHSWESAAVLIVLERVGKAIRNPPRDAMLSHAAKSLGGYGKVFGLHEALDQFGAMVGPLLLAYVLGSQGNYREAFAILLVPAVMNLSFVAIARLTYPSPSDLEAALPKAQAGELPRIFWVYLVGAGLVAAGFADYPLIAYHFGKVGSVPNEWIAGFYAVAMAVSGTASFCFGRLFDRFGFVVLVGLTAIAAFFAPLVFLGGFWTALVGAAVWGMGMGAHETIIPAAVGPMVQPQRRASSYGLFTAGYGTFWFVGSAIIGILYDHSLAATIAFCVLCQATAVPIFVLVGRRARGSDSSTRS
jgi:MFS family permease